MSSNSSRTNLSKAFDEALFFDVKKLDFVSLERGIELLRVKGGSFWGLMCGVGYWKTEEPFLVRNVGISGRIVRKDDRNRNLHAVISYLVIT